MQNDEVKEDAETVNSNEGNNESLEDELNDKIESDKKTIQIVRRSNRNRNQRYNIHPDEIGENDNEKDEDYQILEN